MTSIDIFYSFFNNVKKIQSISDFYDYCMKSCNNDGIVLDVGADMCKGLTNYVLHKKYRSTVYCFDLWTRRKPKPIPGAVFIEGDAALTVNTFLSNQTKKIGIVEIDIRGIELQMFHPLDNGLDYENKKINSIINSLMDYVADETIIIISEFHTKEGCSNLLQYDAYALAESFNKFNACYDCLCYGSAFPKSAWIIKENNLRGKDLLNLVSILK